MTPLIEMRSVTKEYRGVPAVTKVDFTLQQRRGPCAARRERRRQVDADQDDGRRDRSSTSGEMLLDGKPVSFATPAEALEHGVAMVFQETSLVPSMTVAQNLYLGDEKLFNRIRGAQHRGAAPSCSRSISTSNPTGDGLAASARRTSRWSRSRARCARMRASSSSTSRPHR